MDRYSRRQFVSACAFGGLTGAAVTGRGRAGTADARRGTDDRADVPETRWNRTYSTGPDDEAVAAVRSDEGIVVAGTTSGEGDDPVREMWLFELDGTGETVWEETYGEKQVTEATALVSTSDGYLLAGVTRSESDEGQSALAVKVDDSGDRQWSATYSQTVFSTDVVGGVTKTGDGGFVLAGWTDPRDDGWLVRIDGSGTEVWQKRYGGAASDKFRTVTRTDDGNFVAAGQTTEGSGNAIRGWAIEVDGSGGLAWNRRFRVQTGDISNPEKNLNVFHDSTRAESGGYVFVGETATRKNGSQRNGWVLKINTDGKKNWGAELSDQSFNALYGISRTGLRYYVCGETATNGGRDNRQGLAGMLDFLGDVEWLSAYTNGGSSSFTDLVTPPDGGAIQVGVTEPSDGSASSSAWSVKVGGDPITTPTPTSTPTATPTSTPTATPTATPTPTPSPTPPPTPTPTDTPSSTPTATPTPTVGPPPETTTGGRTTTGGGPLAGLTGDLPLPLIGGGLLAAALAVGGALLYRSRGGDDTPAPGEPVNWGGGDGSGPGATTETLDRGGSVGGTVGGTSEPTGSERTDSGDADDGSGTEGTDGIESPDVDPMGGSDQPDSPYPGAGDEADGADEDGN